MQSNLVAGRLHQPAEVERLTGRDLDVGLCICVCIFCALAGCFALELYELMQPTRYPNPGVSAYQLPSEGTGVSAYHLPSEGTAAFTSVIGPEMKTSGEAAPQPSKSKKLDRGTAPVSVKRIRPLQPRGRDQRMAYGAQPTFGTYRPWPYEAWGSYRAWR